MQDRVTMRSERIERRIEELPTRRSLASDFGKGTEAA